MLAALVVAGVIFIPQAFVKDPGSCWRSPFLVRISNCGIESFCQYSNQKNNTGFSCRESFWFSMSAVYLGGFAGAILGGQVAAYLGIRYVFFITSALMLMNAVWVYFKVYKKLSL